MLKSSVIEIILLGCLLSTTLGQDAFQIKRKFFHRNQRQQLSSLSQGNFNGYQESGVAPSIPFNLPNEIEKPANFYGAPSKFTNQQSINPSNEYKRNLPIATIYGVPAFQNKYQSVENLMPYQPQTSTNIVFMKKVPLYKMQLQPPITVFEETDGIKRDFHTIELPNSIEEDELDDLNSTRENETVLISVDEDGNVFDLPVKITKSDKNLASAHIPKRLTAEKIRLNGLGFLYVKRFE